MIEYDMNMNIINDTSSTTLDRRKSTTFTFVLGVWQAVLPGMSRSHPVPVMYVRDLWLGCDVWVCVGVSVRYRRVHACMQSTMSCCGSPYAMRLRRGNEMNRMEKEEREEGEGSTRQRELSASASAFASSRSYDSDNDISML